MSINISIKSGEKNVNMDVEPNTTINEVIDRAMSYWGKRTAPHIMMRNSKILPGSGTIVELSVAEGDILELIRSPEGG